MNRSVGAFALAMLAFSPVAQAQRGRRAEPVVEAPPPPSALAQAEQAYLDVDFTTALTTAQAALREGGHTPQELMRIYQLLGVCSAAEGHAERARDFFLRMLAIDPNAELDDTVPPRLRAPFLEARGIVGARPARLGAEVGISRAQGSVHVAFTDPFQVGQIVVIHARIEGQAEFTSTEERARASIDMRLAGSADADRVEYWLEVRDPFGNQVLTLGSEFEPRVVGRMNIATGPASSEGAGGNVLDEAWFWVVVGVVVAGGVTTGVILGVQSSQIELQTAIDFRM